MRLLVCTALAAFLLGACWVRQVEPEPARWFRGNTHTHTLWSDGDAAPEAVVAWYAENDYDFLVLSDHNVFQDHERWFPVAEDGKGRLKPAELDALVERFGSDAVELRGEPGAREMRLLTFAELQEQFARDGEFTLVPGEEVTSAFEGKPVHVNAVNTSEAIPAAQGGSVAEVLDAALASIVAQGERLGRPVLAHLNHPNFGWGLTWQEVASMRADRFFEVYNGHRSVRNAGDAEHPSTEAIWDRALVLRLTELGLPVLYGVATDDAHHFHGNLTAISGRGWVMVRAAALDGDSLVEAMQRGDFYASSGVTLREVDRGEDAYVVEIDNRPGESCVTRFLGTRMSDGVPGPAGELLLETRDNPAVYRYRGDELYVRAVVVSSEDHPRPYAEGDKQTAWTQPVARLDR